MSSVLERLRVGHGILSPTQFREAVQCGDMEVWQLPGNCYALMEWGYVAEGRALNILTTVGTMEAAGPAFEAIERGARAGGAAVILSVGAPGWTRLAMKHGYEVEPRILMRKVLS